MTTRADARAALYAVVNGVVADVKDRLVKPGDATSPAVLINYLGSTATTFNYQVEVYVKADTIADSQDLFDETVQAVDDALDAASIGPPGDNSAYDDTVNAWVAVFAVEYPRDDFG